MLFIRAAGAADSSRFLHDNLTLFAADWRAAIAK
jgi:hypothetical protein